MRKWQGHKENSAPVFLSEIIGMDKLHEHKENTVPALLALCVLRALFSNLS
jgi:hypothetical protein